MSAWPGKFVIGLTGNIGAGKSVVRKMLEHLGAYGIDADALAHRAIARGAPGYDPLVKMFGRWILRPNGEIDREKLGRLAFADPEAMRRIEEVIHPLVGQAINWLVTHSPKDVIVIEAVKLLETDLRRSCDSIWVVTAPREQRILRLISKRKMRAADARQRVDAQGSDDAKIAAADVVIYNDETFDKTWLQVKKAWEAVVPREFRAPVAKPKKTAKPAASQFVLQKAGPKHAKEIAEFISANSGRTLSRVDVMAAFGEKAYLLLRRADKIVGLLGWQVENLVARANEFYLAPSVSLEQAAPLLVGEMERGSKELQCEAALLFIPPSFARNMKIWKQLGYEPKTPKSLGVRAWQEAALESQPPDTVMLFKQLRRDRVLRPL